MGFQVSAVPSFCQQFRSRWQFRNLVRRLAARVLGLLSFLGQSLVGSVFVVYALHLSVVPPHLTRRVRTGKSVRLGVLVSIDALKSVSE